MAQCKVLSKGVNRLHNMAFWGVASITEIFNYRLSKDLTISPFSENSRTTHTTQHWPKEWFYPFHMGWLMLYCTQPMLYCTIPHDAILYLYHTGQPRSFMHGSPYHIYHLPIWVMHLNTFDMEHIIYIWDSFFNMNSTVMFIL